FVISLVLFVDSIPLKESKPTTCRPRSWLSRWNSGQTIKPCAKKARERRTGGKAQKPFVETLQVGILPGQAGTSSRKRVLRAVTGDRHHEA
ncbi:MAG TPA: hypothetical protein VN648_02155, partial [Candidatus Methylomirabilis sp.]|nr:hypothetical protein [Candidatus Methylomirabilis sp.]